MYPDIFVVVTVDILACHCLKKDGFVPFEQREGDNESE